MENVDEEEEHEEEKDCFNDSISVVQKRQSDIGLTLSLKKDESFSRFLDQNQSRADSSINQIIDDNSPSNISGNTNVLRIEDFQQNDQNNLMYRSFSSYTDTSVRVKNSASNQLSNNLNKNNTLTSV